MPIFGRTRSFNSLHFNQNFSANLKCDSEISKYIKVTRGIKQGKPLSVHLLIGTSKSNKELSFTINKDLDIKLLAFANDLVILAILQIWLQRSITCLVLGTCRHDHHFRVLKTLVMWQSIRPYFVPGLILVI